MNREEIEKELKDAKCMLRGHFCLTSGLHSDVYFQCAKLYENPKKVELLAKELSSKLQVQSIDTVVSPAIGGIIFGYELAKQLGKRNLFVERKDGKMQLRRGFELKKGERVLIVEDVVTTAKTIRETIEVLENFDVEIIGYACIIDRTKGKTRFEFKSLLKKDPNVYEPDDCPLCKENMPIDKPGSRV